MAIRVLIVDDSRTMRSLLMARLAPERDIEVVATAASAQEARALIRELAPDVVTLDIEMPQMNGLDFLEKIMRLRPTPVIVVSGATQEGARATAQALALGAVDCYAKANRYGELLLEDDGRLAQLIRQAARIGCEGLAQNRMAVPIAGLSPADARLIAVGSSTGGVEALHRLFQSFPEDCPPTLVVQHINAKFAGAVAMRLDANCPPRVVLAETDTVLQRGTIYLAPGGERHLVVSGDRILTSRLRAGEQVSGHRPSVDVLFASVAACVPVGAVGILLTGMGCDGAQGLLAMKRAGARTIAQNEATCTVFGMPKAAINIGAAHIIAPIDEIAGLALRKAA